ncbi:hypothetical protein AXF42_Ash000300 [Apostasia shenzhenica]|uniref:Uncharacterized protein n=1 Tax=Apostasia shenzhenica TaxID=1088818 RepID=A0A2I0AG05_9ASPA|nr:hypothetical protein AXF42_Ash000300 [Apostasia shenzhenica]
MTNSYGGIQQKRNPPLLTRKSDKTDPNSAKTKPVRCRNCEPDKRELDNLNCKQLELQRSGKKKKIGTMITHDKLNTEFSTKEEQA